MEESFFFDFFWRDFLWFSEGSFPNPNGVALLLFFLLHYIFYKMTKDSNSIFKRQCWISTIYFVLQFAQICFPKLKLFTCQIRFWIDFRMIRIIVIFSHRYPRYSETYTLPSVGSTPNLISYWLEKSVNHISLKKIMYAKPPTVQGITPIVVIMRTLI